MILELPPRHSKSMTVTETFPSYFIGKDPERRVISVSYSDALARKFGRANKIKLQEYGPDLFEVRVSKDNSSAVNWSIQGHRGGMISAGLSSSITGEGADLLLIDDPIKNRREADSITYRERLWDEWRNTLLTRLQPGAAIIIILTRWHEDDLVGRILLETDDLPGKEKEWRIITLPALAEPGDLLKRKPGEPLWPEFGYTKEWAEKKKVEVGSRAWNALFQQRPAPHEGAILKKHWWRFWCYPGQVGTLPPVVLPVPESEGGGTVARAPEELPDNFDLIAQSWDMAFKSSRESSYVVGQVWAQKGANRYLRDQLRKRLDFPETIRAVLEMNKKWPEARTKWIEDKANGPAVIQTLRRKVAGMIPVTPFGDKAARGHAITPELEAGNIYLPHPHIAPWVDSFIEECSTAPFGATDDQYDACTQALSKMAGKQGAARGGRKPRGL